MLATIAAAERSLKRLTVRDSVRVVTATNDLPQSPQDCATPGACRWVTTVSPTAELRNTLDPRPGYFLVLDERSRLLYSSFAFRQLPRDEQDDLNAYALELVPGGAAVVVAIERDTILGGRMLLVARADSALAPNISRVIAGLPTSSAEVPAQLLLGTMFLLAPLIFLVSLGVAYWLAGHTFRPVDVLITEVEAITDGRSLHRRVPTDEADDELSRLSDTLNRDDRATARRRSARCAGSPRTRATSSRHRSRWCAPTSSARCTPARARTSGCRHSRKRCRRSRACPTSSTAC